MYEEPKNGQYRYAWGVLQARLEDAAHTRPVAQSSNRSRMGWTTPSNLPWSCTTPARSVGLNPATCAMTSLGWRPTRLTRSAAATGQFRCEVRGERAAEAHVFPRRGTPLAVSLEFRGQTRNPVTRTPDSEITDGKVKS